MTLENSQEPCGAFEHGNWDSLGEGGRKCQNTGQWSVRVRNRLEKSYTDGGGHN